MSLGQKLVTVGLNDRWKASTLTFLASHSGLVTPFRNAGTPFFKPDGTQLYATTTVGGVTRLRQYALSSAWNLSTASLSYTTSTSTTDGLFLSSDGLKLYFTNSSNEILEYNISSAWNLSSGISLANTFSPGFSCRDFYFRDDGKLLFVKTNAFTLQFKRLSLSTAWNTSTATLDQEILTSPDSEGLWAKPDGTRMYIGKGGAGNSAFLEYKMSTPWDVTTLSLRTTSSVLDRGQFSIKPDGSRLYKFNYTSGVLQEYSMG